MIINRGVIVANNRIAKGATAMLLSDPTGEEREPVETATVVNELDAAYEAIPEAERESWYERADRELEAAGMPGWMRITTVVKEVALKLWVGSTIPARASG